MNRIARNLALIALVCASQFALCQDYKYRGSAFGARTMQSGKLLFTALQVGPLPAYRDKTLSASVGAATYQDVVSVGSAAVQTASSHGTVNSTATIQSLTVRTTDMPAGTYLLTAGEVESQSQATFGERAKGTATVTDLTILGNAITPTGKINERYEYSVPFYGTVVVILNARDRDDNGATLTTVGIRVILPDGTKCDIARTTAGVPPVA